MIQSSPYTLTRILFIAFAAYARRKRTSATVASVIIRVMKLPPASFRKMKVRWTHLALDRALTSLIYAGKIQRAFNVIRLRIKIARKQHPVRETATCYRASKTGSKSGHIEIRSEDGGGREGGYLSQRECVWVFYNLAECASRIRGGVGWGRDGHDEGFLTNSGN